MKTIRVKIDDFIQEHINESVIPEDIMVYFNQCFFEGKDYANIRESVYEEMKINKFYNEHPDLRPETDWETIILSRKVINLMKQYIKNGFVDKLELDDIQVSLAIFINNRKAKNNPNKPLDNIESLYEDIMWIKSLQP